MAIITTTNGYQIQVDDDDIALVLQYRWYAYILTRGCYAARQVWHPEERKNRLVYMHREIMDAQPGQYVDHINHNGFDNRRCNLRICTNVENLRNSPGHRDRASQYKGVSMDRKRGKYVAMINNGQRAINLGYFDSERDAALAYNDAARKHFGDFAYINAV